MIQRSTKQISYEPGAIGIPLGFLEQVAPVVHLDVVQHRLTQDEFNGCWERMKSLAAINFILTKVVGIILILIFFTFFFFIYAASKRVSVELEIVIGMVVAFLLCCGLHHLNQANMKKKLTQFFQKENHEIWNGKGLSWKYAEHLVRSDTTNKYAKERFLELRVLNMEYTAPGQFGSSFQGAIPNPYMQPQVTYSPQMELRKYSQYAL